METIEIVADQVTGESFYLQRKLWDWVGEIRLFRRNMAWLKNICTRHGVAFAEQESQEVILFAHRNHKFEFVEFVDFLKTFFPVAYSHNLTSRLT